MAARSPKTDKQMILRRVRWLYVIFLFMAASIIGRIVWIKHGPQGDVLRSMADSTSFTGRVIPSERGDILARDGRVLATSVQEFKMCMDFSLTTDAFPGMADTLAGSLARLPGDRSKGEYKALLMDNFRKKNRYVVLSRRNISYTELKQTLRYPWFDTGRYKSGYRPDTVPTRLMPMKPLAHSVIGNTGRDSTVLNTGLELVYDSLLRGTDGWEMRQKISGSFKMRIPDDKNSDPVNGMDIVTTLDADIQDVAEDALRDQVEKNSAYWGTVIVMDVPTGDIVAMANMGRRRDGRYGDIFNYGIRQRAEPGSTFKLAALLALLEQGGMHIGDLVNCTPENGQLQAAVGGLMVRDDHRCGVLTLREVFEQSSNIGFAKSVYARFGGDAGRFVDYVRDSLHMSGTTGIDLPYERGSDIKHPVRQRARWDATALQRMSYGYALEVTPLKTLSLYNAVANNGLMMRPRMVSEVRSYGQTVRRMEPDTVGMIASAGTIRAAQQALAGVVEAGTGRTVMAGAAYSAVAKTGTAQQVREGHRGYKWPDGSQDILATFVGYFPIEKPKYSCIVTIKLHEPRGRKYYGSNVAGPVFRAVADRLYARSVELHDKTYGGVRALAATVKPSQAAADSLGIPRVVGLGLKDAVYVLECAGLRVSFTGSGTVVGQQVDGHEARLTLR